MNQHADAHRLQIVYSREKPRIAASQFRNEVQGPQGALFPISKPGVVVFVQIPKVQPEDFIEVIRQAEPSFVIDLRIAPRFDIGNLNRHAAFALFDEVKATYVDATSPRMSGEQTECSVQRLKEFVAKADSRRPLLFLFGSEKGSILSGNELLELLSLAGKSAEELVLLPA